MAVAVCLISGLSACGTGSYAIAPSAPMPSAPMTPLPSPSSVRPIADAGATGSEARALLWQAGPRSDASGVSEHSDELRTWTLTRGSSNERWMSGWSVEQTTSDTWRGDFVWTSWTGSAATLHDVVVHGVKYQRRSVAGGWRYVGPVVGTPSAKQWVTSELAVARTVRIVATAEVDGVRCIGVQVKVDLSVACKKYPSSDAFYVTLRDLSATKDQETRWAATGTETDVIWIGRTDHLIHEQVDDYAAPAGKRGVLRCHSAESWTDIGEKIVPPITVPSPVSTPLQLS